MFKITNTGSTTRLLFHAKNKGGSVVRMKHKVKMYRHKEPRNISWQWSVRGLDPTKCKDLCLSRKCPKPSFFPRFKKVYVPEDTKSCPTIKKKQTWKEFFSYLLPQSGKKPPLIKCRRLQQIRRNACRDPASKDCCNDDCCPPPVEWYGQAVIYDVPSRFPQPRPIVEPKPCDPPESIKPRCVLALKGVCPEPNEKIRLEDYAYKKPFESKTCIEVSSSEIPSTFQCPRPCPKMSPPLEGDKSLKLTCPSFTEFKEVEIPSQIYTRHRAIEFPTLSCLGDNKRTRIKESVTISAPINKRSCEKTLLKQRNNECGTRSIHFQANTFLNHNENPKSVFQTEDKTTQFYKFSESENKMPLCLMKETQYQPSRMGSDIRVLLTKSICDHDRAEGMYSPPEPYLPRVIDKFQEPLGINPELLALAEKTKQQQRHKHEPETGEVSVFKLLSKATIDRIRKEESDKMAKGERISNPIVVGKGFTNKLSLLNENYTKPNSEHKFMSDTNLTRNKDCSQGCRTIMTEANIGPHFAKKNTKKPKEEENEKICAGCLGVKKAEEDALHPPPKPFIQCKMKPSGKCDTDVGDTVLDPVNPYWKHKAKPLSLCNKPRKEVCVKERGYDMPCEQGKGKRKFHASASNSHFSETSFLKPDEPQDSNNKKLEKALTNAYYKREWQVDKNGGSPLLNIHHVPEDAAEIRDSYIKLFTNRAKETEQLKETNTECIVEKFTSVPKKEVEPGTSWFERKTEAFNKNVSNNIPPSPLRSASMANQTHSLNNVNSSVNSTNSTFNTGMLNSANVSFSGINSQMNNSNNVTNAFKEKDVSNDKNTFEESTKNERDNATEK